MRNPADRKKKRFIQKAAPVMFLARAWKYEGGDPEEPDVIALAVDDAEMLFDEIERRHPRGAE